jgi:hypothetical protein
MKGQTLKTILWSAVGGAIVWWIVLGAAWGWMSPASAEKMATERADAAVLKALTPMCVAKFQQASDKEEKLKGLQSAGYWRREDFVIEQGWATLPGSEEPWRQVAEACAERILADSSS